MKRILLYGLILGAALLLPVKRVDVAQLRPIEVIYIYKEDNTVILQTDTDDLGVGTDARSALENMKQTSPAVIYLDTAQYLLIGEGAQEAALQLQGALKDSIQLCMAEGEIALKDAAKYLPVHGDLPEFGQWETGEKLPILRAENDRIKLS